LQWHKHFDKDILPVPESAILSLWIYIELYTRMWISITLISILPLARVKIVTKKQIIYKIFRNDEKKETPGNLRLIYCDEILS
jgi:hypothetical protein